MAKDFLACLGLIFLTLLIILGVGIIAYLITTFGLVAFPDEFLTTMKWNKMPSIRSDQISTVEWQNPLGQLNTASQPLDDMITPAPIPTLTPSPIPTLDPDNYRKTVNERLKSFVAALEDWRDHNNELVKNSSLASDDAWVRKMKISLEVVVVTSQELADVGPPPLEYASIDGLLGKIPTEARGLREDYLQAIKTLDTQAFLSAGDHFSHIKEALSGAVTEMLALGWAIE